MVCLDVELTIRIDLRNSLFERLSSFKCTELILIPCPSIPYWASTIGGEDVDHTFKQSTRIYTMLAHSSKEIMQGVNSTRIVVDRNEEPKIPKCELNLIRERLKTLLENTHGHLSRFCTMILHEGYTNTHVSLK